MQTPSAVLWAAAQHTIWFGNQHGEVGAREAVHVVRWAAAGHPVQVALAERRPTRHAEGWQGPVNLALPCPTLRPHTSAAHEVQTVL